MRHFFSSLPLVGEGREGGGEAALGVEWCREIVMSPRRLRTPTPNPSPQGRGELGACSKCPIRRHKVYQFQQPHETTSKNASGGSSNAHFTGAIFSAV
jgi:hypothetical protein